MSKKSIRTIMLHVNKLQKCIIYPVLVSCLTACTLTILYLFLFYVLDDQTANIYNLHRSGLRTVIPWVMMGLSCLLFFVVIWTYKISNKLVGPYERVLKELDDILAGKRKDKIGTRPGDTMFEGLLERINALIDKLPE